MHSKEVVGQHLLINIAGIAIEQTRELALFVGCECALTFVLIYYHVVLTAAKECSVQIRACMHEHWLCCTLQIRLLLFACHGMQPAVNINVTSCWLLENSI